MQLKGCYQVCMGKVAPDGKHVFLGVGGGHLAWVRLDPSSETKTAVERFMESKHEMQVGMLDVCPDSVHAASAYRQFRLWDTNTGQTIKMINFEKQVIGGAI